MNKQTSCAQDRVELISKIALWVLIGISIAVLAVFLFIGYDTPYEEDPKFINPEYTDVLLVWTYLIIAITAVATIAAVIIGFVNGSRKSLHEEKGLASKAGIIAWGIFIISLAAGIAIGFANKGETLLINGKDWNDPTDIIMTDASMISILCLTIVTVLATVFSMVTNKK